MTGRKAAEWETTTTKAYCHGVSVRRRQLIRTSSSQLVVTYALSIEIQDSV